MSVVEMNEEPKLSGKLNELVGRILTAALAVESGFNAFNNHLGELSEHAGRDGIDDIRTAALEALRLLHPRVEQIQWQLHVLDDFHTPESATWQKGSGSIRKRPKYVSSLTVSGSHSLPRDGLAAPGFALIVYPRRRQSA